MTLLSTAVRISRLLQIVVHRAAGRKTSPALPFREDVLGDGLSSDQLAGLGFEIEHRTRLETKSVPHGLRDRHLAFLGDDRFHTLMVQIPTSLVKWRTGVISAAPRNPRPRPRSRAAGCRAVTPLFA